MGKAASKTGEIKIFFYKVAVTSWVCYFGTLMMMISVQTALTAALKHTSICMLVYFLLFHFIAFVDVPFWSLVLISFRHLFLKILQKIGVHILFRDTWYLDKYGKFLSSYTFVYQQIFIF
jgi:hypothetical protein